MDHEGVCGPLIAYRVMMVAPVGRDPELKYRPDGQAAANFSVTRHVGRARFGRANVTGNRNEKTVEVNQDISDEITVIGKLAEICAKYLVKGQKIYISGRRLTRRNADGKREHVIFAEGIHFAGALPEVENVDNAGRDVTRWIPNNELPPALRK